MTPRSGTRTTDIRRRRRVFTYAPLSFALAALAALVAAPAAAVTSEGGSEDSVTWSVAPSDASGPDGRAWMELDLEPGAVVDEHLAIHNLSDTDVTFRIDAQDGYLTDKGRFNMLPSDAESTDAGTWIEVVEEISVAAGALAVVPFRVHVPADATPGDHAAGIAASVQSVGTGADGAELTVESRVGFRVMARVGGELRPSIEISEVSAEYHLDWNPFEAGTADVTYVVRNTGNTRVRFIPDVRVVGISAENPSDAAIEMLPDDERTFSATAIGVWPSIVAPVAVSARPEVIIPPGFDESPPIAAVNSDILVPALPWPQLVVVAGIALLVFAYLRDRRRRREALQAMLEQARREGVRSALDPPALALDDAAPMPPSLR